MADRVPTSGAWQTDPELHRLLRAQQAAIGTGSNARGTPGGQRGQAESLALKRYIVPNRGRLGIPDNYWPDPRTGGQTLYDPNQNQLRDALIIGGSMAAGGYALGATLPSAAAPTATATAPTATTAPAIGLSPLVTPGYNMAPAIPGVAARSGPFLGLSSLDWALGAVDVGSRIAGSVIGARASKKAAEQQEAAVRRAQALDREYMARVNTRMAPFLERSGQQAQVRLDALSRLGPPRSNQTVPQAPAPAPTPAPTSSTPGERVPGPGFTDLDQFANPPRYAIPRPR